MGSPTGLVLNGNASEFHGDRLIAVTEDGFVTGATPAGSVTGAMIEVDDSASSAVLKGAAIASTASGDRLFATDFHNGKVLVFDTQFHDVTPPGSFVDPNTPAGFAPFNVASMRGQLLVAYAKQDAERMDDQKGAGNGFIDVFRTNGTFVRRFASGTAAGGKLTVLNSPWGMAPARSGPFGRGLLVGNFGSGQIAILQLRSGRLQKLLKSRTTPVSIDGLWSIAFGPGGAAGDSKTLFFTAGPNSEDHGLFGTLTAGTAKRRHRR
jgi:uncharacterized protein (TIGR03118 family)